MIPCVGGGMFVLLHFCISQVYQVVGHHQQSITSWFNLFVIELNRILIIIKGSLQGDCQISGRNSSSGFWQVIRWSYLCLGIRKHCAWSSGLETEKVVSRQSPSLSDIVKICNCPETVPGIIGRLFICCHVHYTKYYCLLSCHRMSALFVAFVSWIWFSCIRPQTEIDEPIKSVTATEIRLQ